MAGEELQEYGKDYALATLQRTQMDLPKLVGMCECRRIEAGSCIPVAGDQTNLAAGTATHFHVQDVGRGPMFLAPLLKYS
jgi:hypothetical protein